MLGRFVGGWSKKNAVLRGGGKKNAPHPNLITESAPVRETSVQ